MLTLCHNQCLYYMSDFLFDSGQNHPDWLCISHFWYQTKRKELKIRTKITTGYKSKAAILNFMSYVIATYPRWCHRAATCQVEIIVTASFSSSWQVLSGIFLLGVCKIRIFRFWWRDKYQFWNRSFKRQMYLCRNSVQLKGMFLMQHMQTA